MPRRKQEPKKVAEPESKRQKEEASSDENGKDKILIVPSEDSKENKILLSLPENSGEVLICGGTNWSVNSRKKARKGDEKYENVGKNLFKPHRYKSLVGIKVSRVITGCCSNHNLIITNEGNVYSWGRNECGQLGHGNRVRYDSPKPIDSLQSYKVVNGATGKNHTLCLTENGDVFAFGDNAQGQLGLGNLSTNVPSPTHIAYKGNPIVDVSCGGEFSVILDCEGYVYSFGCPEYGQLGNNTDGKYFASGNKMAFDNVKNAFRIPLWVEKLKGGQVLPLNDVKITSISCGNNHVVALDSKKRVFTWGFGGYGRLGHSEQKDEHTPRLLTVFERAGRGAVQVYAGYSFSIALNEMGSTMFWGLQGSISSRETTMYPKPLPDLQGWEIRSIGCGYRHTVVAADESVIVWGTGTSNGELGLGESRKSSANPDLMKSASNLFIQRVSCGQTHTLMIARNKDEKDQAALDEIPLYDPKHCP
uniref:Protein RCC2 homolog n=1 Tax=Ciona intestinalis TaxID=7719 RepID=F6Z188_CIOIN|nr:protein RCC2 homolog [Ciona intestinalis]|eukprot:XP_002126864.1 protein RCC2 homolog [Ciona intestinalis]